MSPSLPFHSPLTHFMATARRLSSYYSGGNCSGRVSLLSWRLSTGTLQTVQVCLLCWGKGEGMTFDLWFLSRFYLDKYREIGSPSSVRLCYCAINELSSHYTHMHTHTHTGGNEGLETRLFLLFSSWLLNRLSMAIDDTLSCAVMSSSVWKTNSRHMGDGS